MKKLLVLAILSLTLSGVAQEKRNNNGMERPEFTPEQKNELLVKKLTLELDLNAKQQKEIYEIVSVQQTKREGMKTQMKAKRAENKKLTSDEKFALRNQVLDEKIAMKNKMKSILNAEQYAKWEKMPKERMEQRREHMKRKSVSKE